MLGTLEHNLEPFYKVFSPSYKPLITKSKLANETTSTKEGLPSFVKSHTTIFSLLDKLNLCLS